MPLTRSASQQGVRVLDARPFYSSSYRDSMHHDEDWDCSIPCQEISVPYCQWNEDVHWRRSTIYCTLFHQPADKSEWRMKMSLVTNMTFFDVLWNDRFRRHVKAEKGRSCRSEIRRDDAVNGIEWSHLVWDAIAQVLVLLTSEQDGSGNTGDRQEGKSNQLNHPRDMHLCY